MGLMDKIFKKDEEKQAREVGSNFDDKQANDIFDALDKVEGKPRREISENSKKIINQTKEVSGLIEEAQALMLSEKFSQAVPLLKKVLTIDPSNGQAYECLADIYHLQDDRDGEIEILKSAINNIDNNKIKNEFVKRLKEIN